MEPKKISFGFSKLNKKPNFLPVKSNKQENPIELIKCLEGQEIKLVEERKETDPIIIPMKEIGKTSAALASLMKRRSVLLGEDDSINKLNQEKKHSQNESNSVSSSNENDLDKQAALEILSDLQKNKEIVYDSNLVLPVLNPNDIPLDGAKESTLNDYESIPIEQYGRAMLRGMGWVEPPPSKEKKLDDSPMVRPKGMGLGADKALKPKPLLVQPDANETLEIKKQAYIRILGGKYKDAYGQIEGFDDGGGRVIVKLAIGGTKEAFNEFLCQPVSKKEFTQYGKCINTKKYEEYKKLENEHGQIIVKKEEPSELKIEFKQEKDEEKFVKSENNIKPKRSPSSSNYDNNGVYSKERYDEYNASSSQSRGRSPTKTHSRSEPQSRSRSRSHSSTNESDVDSAYERRHKNKKKSKSKSKSHSKKSKSNKKKSTRHENNDDTDDNKQHREHSSSKKNKKKTKKSKRERSRTPSRHRR